MAHRCQTRPGAEFYLAVACGALLGLCLQVLHNCHSLRNHVYRGVGWFRAFVSLGSGFCSGRCLLPAPAKYSLPVDCDSLRDAQKCFCAADGDLGRLWTAFQDCDRVPCCLLPHRCHTVVGLREIEPELLDLARIYRGSQLDVFKKIRLPNSLPYMFAGIKVALVLSVTGAIVAEFVAANQGLGYLILQANYSLDTAFALVNLLILAFLSLALFMVVDHVQKRLAPWSAEVRQVEGSF